MNTVFLYRKKDKNIAYNDIVLIDFFKNMVNNKKAMIKVITYSQKKLMLNIFRTVLWNSDKDKLYKTMP